MTIWKFPLGMPTDFTPLSMPVGAAILSLQWQNGQACMWAMVDPHAPTERRAFITVGTGHPVPDGAGQFIGTYQISGYGLVFHVFEAAGGES